MIKKILSAVLIFSLTVGIVAISQGNPVIAKENNISVKMYEFKGYLSDSSLKTITKSYGAIDKSSWSSFSNNYFYNNMNQRQRKFYEVLKAQVEDFFYNEKDARPFEVAGGDIFYGIGNAVSLNGLSSNEASEIYQIFANANPQYFFLSNSSAHDSKFFYMTCVSKFANAAVRRTYNQKYLEIVNSYISDIKSYSDKKEERQRRIHTLLAENLSYASNDPKDWGIHQTSETAVFTNVSVCAGYSELYALLCNAVGIPCICVTSDNHEWNMVQYGDYWYNVDITNDDAGSTPRWKYFNVPTTPSFYEGHTPEAYYLSLNLPKAEYNFGEKPLEEVIVEGAVFRLYNRNNSEHFFTTDISERNNLISKGWRYESIAFISETVDLSVPVYRVYNKNSGEHYYTTSAGERDFLVSKGWRYEKIAFYSNPNQRNYVYVMFNPNSRNAGSHHYTRSYDEAVGLQKKGWRYEKIGWYASE